MGCINSNTNSRTNPTTNPESNPKVESKEDEEFEGEYPFCEPKDYVSLAKVVSCYDGDTIVIKMKYGESKFSWICRLYKIDAYEIKAKRKNKSESEIEEQEELKLKGLSARKYIRDRIDKKIVKVKCFGLDKYRRLLILVFDKKEENLVFENSINKELLDKGLAVSMNDKGQRET